MRSMVKIVTLVENTALTTDYHCKHGLCLYIETAKHKILFDLGQDKLFAENAQKMNIDLSGIDTVIISHGHKDHGGALRHFLKLNNNAKIYIRREAFDPHYIKVLGMPFRVGLEKGLQQNSQFVFTEDKTLIDDELLLFSNVKNDGYVMKSNSVLFAKSNSRLIPDDFCHEQHLVVSAGSHKILVSGCSHAGVVNIQSKAEKLLSDEIGTVIGGFHLCNPPTKKYESNEMILMVANALNMRKSVYYTCHCTGIKAYEQMKHVLGDRLHYLSTGKVIRL